MNRDMLSNLQIYVFIFASDILFFKIFLLGKMEISISDNLYLQL